MCLLCAQLWGWRITAVIRVPVFMEANNNNNNNKKRWGKGTVSQERNKSGTDFRWGLRKGPEAVISAVSYCGAKPVAEAGRHVGPNPGPHWHHAYTVIEDRLGESWGILWFLQCIESLKFNKNLCPGLSGSGWLFSDIEWGHLCRASLALSPGVMEIVALPEAYPMNAREQEFSKAWLHLGFLVLVSQFSLVFCWRVVAKWQVPLAGAKEMANWRGCEYCEGWLLGTKIQREECFIFRGRSCCKISHVRCVYLLPSLLRPLLLVLGFIDFCWLG